MRLAILLALAVLAWLIGETGPARLLDHYAFDRVSLAAPAEPPKVLLLDVDPAFLKANPAPVARLAGLARSHGLKRLCLRAPQEVQTRGEVSLPIVLGSPPESVPASSVWRLNGAEAPGAIRSANGVPAPENGINRRMRAALPGESGPLPQFESACADEREGGSDYLVPTPRAQNLVRITASQLAGGVFAPGELDGFVAIVPPWSPARETKVTIPLDPAHPVAASLFSAYAVQALLSRSAVSETPPSLVPVMVFMAVLLGSTLVALPRDKRFGLPMVVVALVFVLATGLAVLRFGHVLLPLTAMALAALLAGLAEILLRERAQDRYLAAALEEALNLSFDRALFHDATALPEHLASVARALRLPQSAVVGREEGSWKLLAQGRELPGALDVGAKPQRKLFERTLGLMRTQRAADDGVWLSPVAGGESPLLWLYTLPAGPAGERAGRAVRQIAGSLRRARGWQHRLLGAGARADSGLPVDVRVASASNLITVQSEQIRQGLEALDTAVLIFHPAGFALEANSRMAALCGEAGIAPERTGIIEAIRAFTDIGTGQAEAIVRRMLLRGGEMRIPMRAFAGRHYILRVGATSGEDDAWRRVIVLEAVDVSELDQLAQLRLAVGVFIDRQLRNDLEAISLGATLALDERVGPERLARLAERIRDVAVRATGRLEVVSELLEERPLGAPGPCYPVEARKPLLTALERVADFAEEGGVEIDPTLPAISGCTLAEPLMLGDMVEAILRLVIADTARGNSVRMRVQEDELTTSIAISGGFGMPFDRLVEALDANAGEVPGEYRIASAGFKQVLAWQGSVSYWSAAGDGYTFTIQLRRIG